MPDTKENLEACFKLQAKLVYTSGTYYCDKCSFRNGPIDPNIAQYMPKYTEHMTKNTEGANVTVFCGLALTCPYMKALEDAIKEKSGG